jgi:hypothetical protein
MAKLRADLLEAELSEKRINKQHGGAMRSSSKPTSTRALIPLP